MRINLDDVLEFALALADEAGTGLLDIFLEEGRIASRNKKDGSLLTRADVEADNLIVRRIGDSFEGHGILSEEGRTVSTDDRYVWIIDPLDGTTNFSRNIPIWGVSIALAHDGEVVLGVISFPVLRRTYHAVKEKGAFMNNSPVRVESAIDGTRTRLFATCPNTLIDHVIEAPLKMRALGSASYNLVMVAEGDAFGGMESRPKIWDIAAGQLMIEEAGGCVAYPWSKPFFPLVPDVDYSTLSLPLLTAGSKETLQSLIESIRPQ